jgi:hypothetical protein
MNNIPDTRRRNATAEIYDEIREQFFQVLTQFFRDLSDADVSLAWIGHVHSTSDIVKLDGEYNRDKAQFDQRVLEIIRTVGGSVEDEGKPQKDCLNIEALFSYQRRATVHATYDLMNTVQNLAKKSEVYVYEFGAPGWT